jgi:UV DNA damage endonuclease
LGLPVVFDTLHHAINPHLSENPVDFWIDACGATWKPCDGRQKIHYSQQNPGKKPGAHSESIEILPFLDFYRGYQNRPIDVMLEVKDKNISAVKCQMCTSPPQSPALLEREWSRYKYLVMEHSPAVYGQIRHLMHCGSVDPLVFYRLVEEALAEPLIPGRQINAAEHIWGYFKGFSSLGEQTKFRSCIDKLSNGETLSCKRHLHNMAKKHQNNYLLHSYYFSSAI